MFSFFFKPGPQNVGAKLLKAARKTASGMTLVELLVTVVVLAFGISGILKLQSATMYSSSRSSALTMATFLAESQTELLRTMDYNRVAFVSQDPEKLSRSGLDCTGSSPEPCFFTRTTTLTTQVPTTTSTTVSIKVQWLKQELIYDTIVTSTGFF